jgi:hypothetical protein
MVIREGQLVSLKHQPGVMTEEFSLEVPETVTTKGDAEGAQELVPC